MTVIAGTADGIYFVENGSAQQRLSCGNVRDLSSINGYLFAATATGIYRSADSGSHWAQTGLTNYEVWQIRAGAGRLYAGTQPAALFSSTDNGMSWSEMTSFANSPQARDWCVPLDPPLPGRARALAIDREEPNRMWVGVEVGGIMRTTDSGKTWKFNLPGDNPDLHMIVAHPVQPAVLFASTGYGRPDGIAEMLEGNAGVFRSDNHGESWRYVWHGVTPRYSRPMCIDPRAPFGLTVASAPTAFSRHDDDGGANAMLFRSDDCGNNWRSLCDAAHSPSAANIHGLIHDPDVAGGVIIGTDTGEIWRVSHDAQWQQVAAGLPSVLSIASTSNP